MKNLFLTILCLSSLLFACTNTDPNVDASGVDELESLKLDRELSKSDKAYDDLLYVPIYSDIYVDASNTNSLLSATLSIRNTSHQDSLFVSVIDYFNTEGDLVRSYIEDPIVLQPMATVNYYIEKDDVSGGPGANFIVELSSDNTNVKPLVQAVMVGSTSSKAFAFSTDGYSVK